MCGSALHKAILGLHSSGRGWGWGGWESVERAESGKAAFTQERELLVCAGSLLSNYANLTTVDQAVGDGWVTLLYRTLN